MGRKNEKQEEDRRQESESKSLSLCRLNRHKKAGKIIKDEKQKEF